MDEIENLIKTGVLDVGYTKSKGSPSADHRNAISESKLKFFQSEEGIAARKLKSEKMKEFWASDEGQKRRVIHAAKCGRKQVKKVDADGRQKIAEQYANGVAISKLAEDYDVSRMTITRYILSITGTMKR